MVWYPLIIAGTVTDNVTENGSNKNGTNKGE